MAQSEDKQTWSGRGDAHQRQTQNYWSGRGKFTKIEIYWIKIKNVFSYFLDPSFVLKVDQMFNKCEPFIKLMQTYKLILYVNVLIIYTLTNISQTYDITHEKCSN